MVGAILCTDVTAQITADSAMLQAHAHELSELIGVRPAVLVLELREIVERAGARGGRSVGALSHSRLVEGFEASLIAQSRPIACTKARRAPEPAVVLQVVLAAAQMQRLTLTASDGPALSARAQLLIEALPPATWCALRTLDDVR